MSLFTPDSSAVLTDLGLLAPHRRATTGAQSRARSFGSSSWLSRCAVVSTLGDKESAQSHSGHSVVRDAWGSTGCVNAVDWGGPDGSWLATGGDDTKICIWKPGVDPSSDEQSTSDSFPKFAYGLTDTIDTGHRANIFSIKWAPTSSTRLFSCAGDAAVKVYDLNLATNPGLSSVSIGGGGTHPEWTHHGAGSAVTNVFRCHEDRVKRVATENSPDVFLTCSEDGTVRQHDLRAPHTCRQRGMRNHSANCPPPLASYSGLSLYSLSISTLRPHLFVVAGTSPYAYLHDRRMLREPMKRDWGVDMQEGEFTQCVRRFGVPRTVGRAGEITNHVVATKLSLTNARDLIVSYSGQSVFLFDIDGEPQQPTEQTPPDIRSQRHRQDDQDPSGRKDSQEEEPEAESAGDRTLRRDMTTAEMGNGSVVPEKRRHEGDEESTQVPPSEAEREGSIGPHLHEAVLAAQAERAGEGGADDDREEISDNTEDEDEDDEEEERANLFTSLGRRRRFHESVPMVAPRASYSGHSNEQTVKDVNFVEFGDASHVVSGSDDGNWFAWNTASGELEGIYHGDSSVVNVLEGHPRLPLVACSGIDTTVKLFGPVGGDAAAAASSNLIGDKDQIVQRNKESDSRPSIGGIMTAEQMMALLMARMPPGSDMPHIRIRREGEDGGEEDEGECVVQ